MASRGILRTTAVIALCAIQVTCSKQSPTAPTQTPPTPTPHPSISVASVTVQGEARSSGYAYSATVQLKETAGVAATISGIDLVFLNGPTTVASSHADHPISDTSNTCPASGSVGTRTLLTEDPDASHPYATTVQVKVAFTGDGGFTGSATGSADVPALAAPAPPQTFALTGVITDSTTHAGIEGATLEVLNGQNAGKTAITDSGGGYIFRELVAETFRLRASANGHDSGEQNVTVPTVPRADFELRPVVTACAYTVSPSFFSAPGAGASYTVTATRTMGTCSWTAASSFSWITFSGPASGSGSASIGFTIAPTTVTRTGSFTISWQGGSATVDVSQNQPRVGCPAVVEYDVTAEAHQFLGHLPASCTSGSFIGTSAIDVPWLKFTATHGGGTMLDFAVDANPGPTRTGHMTLSDGPVVYTTFTVVQAAGDCVTAISPTSQIFDVAGGTGTIAVTAKSGCTWQASVHSSSIDATVTAGAEGTGNGSVSFSVGINPDVFPHLGFVLVGVLTDQLTQAACPVTVSPLTVRAPSGGGSFTVNVAADRSFCHWSDYSNASFISLTAGWQTGTAAVTFVVSANTTGQSRTGTLYVAGQTVVVTQDP